MPETKPSQLTTRRSAWGATDRIAVSGFDTDWADYYALPEDLISHTGDVTGGIDAVLTIAANAVTEAKISDGAVTQSKLASNAVTSAKINDDAVTQAKIAASAVGTTEIADGSVTAAKLASSAGGRTPNIQTGTAYTLVAGDANTIVYLNNASPVTVTVPAAVFSAGDQIDFIQKGAGQVTFVAGSGLTLNTPETLKLEKQYAGGTINFETALLAYLSGQLELA